MIFASVETDTFYHASLPTWQTNFLKNETLYVIAIKGTYLGHYNFFLTYAAFRCVVYVL